MKVEDKQGIPIVGQGNVKESVLEFRRKFFQESNYPVLVTRLNENNGKPLEFKCGADMPLAIIQNGNEAFVISRRWKESRGDFVVYEFSQRKLDAKERQKLIELSTLCSITEPLVGFYNNGKKNVPTVIFERPQIFIGHNRSFCMHYTPIVSFDLRNPLMNYLGFNGTNTNKVEHEGKGLLSVDISASQAKLIREKDSRTMLEDVFKESDLKLVEEVNEKLDKEHMKHCYVTYSCIDRSQFEQVSPLWYPRYNVAADLNGKIYEAKRLEPKTK